jgi:biotin carboxylase
MSSVVGPYLSIPVPFAQFGHLFAKGETRDAALRNMVVALGDVAIRGEIHTIVDYVLDMMQVGEECGMWCAHAFLAFMTLFAKQDCE